MHHDSVADELRTGWLTFAAGTDRRRLAPIPRRWESMKEERLRLALGAAIAVVSPRLSTQPLNDHTLDEPPRAEPAS